MAHPLDIGIASYGNPEALQRTIAQLQKTTQGDWRCLIVNNIHPDIEIQTKVDFVIDAVGMSDHRFLRHNPNTNLGYAGAVNILLDWAESEYIAYCDNDAFPLTDGWNVLMASLLDRFHEIGMLFPNGGAYAINRGPYQEILWGVGCFWMLPRYVKAEVGLFDAVIGHQNEVDYQTRVRLGGYKIASCAEVNVYHAGSASANPDAMERIRDGVVAWVNKWNQYFCGKGQNYFSTNVLRHEDWHPSALYLEQYWQQRLPGLNATPEEVVVDGIEYDLIKVPRFKGFYRGRVI
jgi:GT2 family glycosyltransferase